MQEVGGSIPPGSTKPFKKPPPEAAFLLTGFAISPSAHGKGTHLHF
jgi:hypothetical protein